MKRVQVLVVNTDEVPYISEATPDPSQWGADFESSPENPDYLVGPDLGDGFVVLIPDEQVDAFSAYITGEWAKECQYKVSLTVTEENHLTRTKRWVKWVGEQVNLTPTNIIDRYNMSAQLYRPEFQHRPTTLDKIKKICKDFNLDLPYSVNYLSQGF